MKHFARSVRSMFKDLSQAAAQRSEAQRVQALLDELEDPPPNSLLVNLATGFPSALLCVLAAGALAGALAGRQVGGANFSPAAPADTPAVVLALQQTAPQPAAAPANVQALLAGRHAHLDRLEEQVLAAEPGAR